MLKKVIFSLIVLSIIAGLISYGLLHYHYSDGVRSGQLVKISKKGVLFKTYEGILDLGSGDRLTWEFSVHDSKVGDELISLSGKKIKLSYTELLYKVFYNTKYNITGWEVLDDKGEGHKDFCRLVHLMRKSRNIVENVKSLMSQFDPQLLVKARYCQSEKSY